MAVQFKVLGSQSRVAGANTVRTLYTCPALTTAVVLTVDVHNFGSAGDVGFGSLVGSTQFTWTELSSLGTNVNLPWRGKHVLTAGQKLYVFGASGTTLSVWISGYEIT